MARWRRWSGPGSEKQLMAGLLVLLSGHGDADLQKAAGGWVGVVVGYWLG